MSLRKKFSRADAQRWSATRLLVAAAAAAAAAIVGEEQLVEHEGGDGGGDGDRRGDAGLLAARDAVARHAQRAEAGRQQVVALLIV